MSSAGNHDACGSAAEPPPARHRPTARLSAVYCRITLGAVAAGIITLAPLSARADLTDVPGLTPAEASAAAGTQAVYTALLNKSSTTTLTSGEQSLFELTRELVQTANEQQGTGPTQFSLGLTVEGLSKALQWVAAEELTTPGTMATKTTSGQLTSVSARLTALKLGATGFHMSMQDNGLPDTALAMNPDDPRGGGGASADKVTGIDFSKLGGFVNGSLGFGSKDPTAREDAFDFGNSNLTFGTDYRLTDKAVFGAAIGYTEYEADFNSSKSVVDGNIKSSGVTGSIYGLYNMEPFSLDGIFSLGGNSFDIVRHIKYPSNNPGVPPTNEVAYGSTDSFQYAFSFGGSYEGHRKALTYSGLAHLNYLHADISGYTETNANAFNLQLQDQGVTSVTTSIGGQVSYALSERFGVLVPEGMLQWYHEFSDGSRNVQARYVADPLASNFLSAPTDSPTRDYFSLGIGVSAVFQRGLMAFLHYETLLGMNSITDNLFTGGVRLEF